jgi:cell wall-associated NlpC family hydrolase
MIDWRRFIGIPEVDLGRDRNGCDCWGLYRLVLREACGIELPSYAGDYMCSRESAEVDRVARGVFSGSPWQQVTGPRRPFDLLLFQRGRQAFHVGLAVDADRMLHMPAGDASSIVPVRDQWHRCLAGVYRHEALA